MANRRRESEEEKAKREREERIELLKMKQGLIEESELIPENGYVEMPKLHGWAKFANLFYHNKAFILLGAFFVTVITVLVVQIATKERDDLYVLAIAFEEDSEIGWRTRDLESALEKYCPDFDGNGKVNVTVNFIDRTSENIISQYEQAQAQKLTAEFMSASSQFIIADEKFINWIGGNQDENSLKPKRVFLDQTDKCSEDMLFNGYGVRINRTEFANEARWKNCPDDVIILVRDELNNGSGNVKTNARNRERALTVLQNILDNNIVNPEAENE